MSEIIISEETRREEAQDKAPLFLQHYLDERDMLFDQDVKKPPGLLPSGRIIERRDNVIVVEFRDKKAAAPRSRKRAAQRRLYLSVWDAAMLVLFFVTAAACVAALMR